MADIPQRWLSLTGICDVLCMRPTQIKSLVRSKQIVRIGNPPDYRYLDPTPEYAERLRLWSTINTPDTAVPIKALFTVREVAEIMGWSLSHAQNTLATIPATAINQRCKLYSAAQVRNLLFRRQGRKKGLRRSPFLLPQLIAYFWRYYQAEAAVVPKDNDFADDDVLKNKLEWMLAQPEHEKMLAEFLEKLELAKRCMEHAPEHTEPSAGAEANRLS